MNNMYCNKWIPRNSFQGAFPENFIPTGVTNLKWTCFFLIILMHFQLQIAIYSSFNFNFSTKKENTVASVWTWPWCLFSMCNSLSHLRLSFSSPNSNKNKGKNEFIHHSELSRLPEHCITYICLSHIFWLELWILFSRLSPHHHSGVSQYSMYILFSIWISTINCIKQKYIVFICNCVYWNKCRDFEYTIIKHLWKVYKYVIKIDNVISVTNVFNWVKEVINLITFHHQLVSFIFTDCQNQLRLIKVFLLQDSTALMRSSIFICCVFPVRPIWEIHTCFVYVHFTNSFCFLTIFFIIVSLSRSRD